MSCGCEESAALPGEGQEGLVHKRGSPCSVLRPKLKLCCYTKEAEKTLQVGKSDNASAD